MGASSSIVGLLSALHLRGQILHFTFYIIQENNQKSNTINAKQYMLQNNIQKISTNKTALVARICYI
jgi:hypothetical protein